MTSEVTLQVEPRTESGKSAARRLRSRGLVPGNLYGREENALSVQMDGHDVELLISRISVENTLVELTVKGGEPRRVLIREIQRHPWRADILHVDFYEITAGEKIKVSVPVRLVGTPVGVRNSGGILQQNRHELEIEVLPSEIPDAFEVDVTELEIGDSLHVADVNTGGVTPTEELHLTVCAVQPPTVIAEPEEEEGEEIEGEEDMEPEVITARGDEEGEDE